MRSARFSDLMLLSALAAAWPMTAAGQAGWQLQSVVNEDLIGVAFLDPQTVVVVGGRGEILRTSDSGGTWTTIESGTRQDLYAISSVDAYTATAVGVNGTIVHSI